MHVISLPQIGIIFCNLFLKRCLIVGNFSGNQALQCTQLVFRVVKNGFASHCHFRSAHENMKRKNWKK